MNWKNLNLIKQIKSSFIFKFLSVSISFLLVRYMLEYLGIRNYGLWSVILTFLNWIIFFDLGIANGVKNKLAESLSKNDINQARKYISTGYIALAFFSLFSFLIVFILSYFINWESVFNFYDYDNEYLRQLVLIILFFILVNFTLSLINAVFNATQKASLIVLNQFLTQFFSLSFLFFLLKFTDTNLHFIAISYGSSTVLSSAILSLWFYKKNSILSPKIIFYDKEKLKPILSLGLRFFLLQITMLVILTSDRFIIIQLISAAEVSKYDIIIRYFNTLIILHTLINTPLWPMYTEAYHKGDYNWIEKIMKNLFFLNIGYFFIIIIMVLLGDIVINLWIDNDEIKFTQSNYIYMGVFSLFSISHSILAYFTNGIGKTNLQLYTSIIGAVLNIPLSIYFVKNLNMGLNGVILATIICLSLFCILGPFQVMKEIKLMKERVL